MSVSTNQIGESITLPQPRHEGSVSVEECILKRRSVRSYTGESMTLADLSQLLWAADGITHPNGLLRASPSAGARYPLEFYAVVGAVEGLPSGTYKYTPEGHTLTRTIDGDMMKELAEVCRGQMFMADASVVLLMSCVSERTTGRYGERGNRYIPMDAGHAAENIALQAVALGFGTCMIGAFSDDDVWRVMQLPKDEAPLYMVTVGRPQ